MATTLHQPHDNTGFQLERLILFSDAVFAIAIALLIIEIKVPHFEGEFNEHQLREALSRQKPFSLLAALVAIAIPGAVGG